ATQNKWRSGMRDHSKRVTWFSRAGRSLALLGVIVALGLAGCSDNQSTDTTAKSSAPAGQIQQPVGTSTQQKTQSAIPDQSTIHKATKAIDTSAIVANKKTTKNWLTYGLNYANTRFSHLDQINTDN